VGGDAEKEERRQNRIILFSMSVGGGGVNLFLRHCATRPSEEVKSAREKVVHFLLGKEGRGTSRASNLRKKKTPLLQSIWIFRDA